MLCSQLKRGALRRQARIELCTQEQLHDPWIRLTDSSPEQIHQNHHHRHGADTTQLVNVHSKLSTMSDEERENSAELNGTVTDPAPEDISETPPDLKKAPPVAPKPSWFRQSLKKIRDENEHTKPSRPAEQRPTVGFNRGFGARAASPATSMSIKQKIHSFETFSSAEGLEKGGNRRTVVPSNSLPVIEKESKNYPVSREIPKAIASTPSALVRETENTVLSPYTVNCSTSEACSQTAAKPSEDKPTTQQSLTDLPPSDTISTDLGSGKDDCQSTSAHEHRHVLTSKQQSDVENEEEMSSSPESTDVPPATSVSSNQDDGEGPPEKTQSQGKLLSMTVSAAPPTDGSSLRGVEGESMEKILAFSNQVILHT